MLIGELAAIVGVSPRTVRHYHRIGLLPEPERQANGYRRYGLRDLLRLTRARRLTELGLSLDETRVALAGDDELELREILRELDADLAEQERAIQQRRRRLADLLARPDELPVTADDAVSGELAELLTEIGARFPDSPTARKDREYLSLLDGAGSGEAGTGPVEVTVSALRRALDDPDQAERIGELYRRFDELADAAVDDPRIDSVVRDVLDLMPRELLAGTGDANPDSHAVSAALMADLTPAQAEVARRIIRRGGATLDDLGHESGRDARGGESGGGTA